MGMSVPWFVLVAWSGSNRLTERNKEGCKSITKPGVPGGKGGWAFLVLIV